MTNKEINADCRKKIRMIKVIEGKKYYEIAKELEIAEATLYQWITDHFDFGEEKLARVCAFIELKEL